MLMTGVVYADSSTSKPSINVSAQTLQLQGSGMRTRMFIDLYVGSLYLSSSPEQASNIVEDNAPMAICLEIESSLISSDKLQEATREGFEQSIGDISAMEPRIEQLLSAFDEPIDVSDTFLLSWDPAKSVIQVHRNNFVISEVPSLDFKQALFGIWLGDSPVQDSLKNEMLGLSS